MDQRSLLSRPQCAQDWKERKDVIVELYELKTLKETMRIMENKHFFKATEKQYKKQLQKWDEDHKRIKPTEYKAMIRKKRQREEGGEKDVRFQLRGLEVEDAKIVRFQKRHRINEPKQVFDCPTPPGLICIIPAPIPPSPGLRAFPWYDMYEKYLDLSMAGASTIQSNDVQSILRSLIVPLPNYEDDCRSLNYWGLGKSCGIVTQNLRAQYSGLFFPALFRAQSHLRCAMSAPNIHDRAFLISYLQGFLEFLVSSYLDRLNNRSYSLPSLDPQGQLVLLWAVTIAGTIHRLSGRRGEAISLLETTIHLVEQHLDLKGDIVCLFYNTMLIELAHCCAEDGHRDEARHLLNKQLKAPPSSEGTIIADMRRSQTYGVLYHILLICKLRKSREEALPLIGGLENGRADTQEHHTRLQEGSCQPGTSEWGPFLTDRMEWDKI